jgi:hypothetical protein
MGFSVLHLVCVTKNKSISSTTLHTLMNIHVGCMQRGFHIEIHFIEDKTTLPKIIRNGERIFFMDYGTNLNNEILHTVFEPFTDGIEMLVYPAVKEGINWEQFIQKTKAGSSEPPPQRGLEFDTIVGNKIRDGLYECEKTAARVWVMDARPVDKRLRGGETPVQLPVTNDGIMFARLQQIGVKIGVMSEAVVVCHFVHECFGNILEAAGIQLAP